MSFYTLAKQTLFALLFLSLAPVLLNSIHKQYFGHFEIRPKVGLIIIKQAVFDSRSYVRQLRKLFNDPDVRAILIHMDCQGGAAGTSDIIFAEIQALKKDHPKPIVTLVENICASGGYLIASATDQIIAPPMSLVGSIGAYFSSIFQFEEALKHHNVGYKKIYAGDYKTATDPFNTMTPEQQEQLQGVLNSSYAHFTNTVALARKLPTADVKKWADGKIFSGVQAFELGLVDKLGSFDDAISYIKQKTLIDGDIEWVKEKPHQSLLKRLINPDTDDTDDSEDGSFVHSMVNNICCAVETRYSKVHLQ